MRQCDGLDGLVDGIINNYMKCRKIFDRTQAPSDSNPWNAKRCPDNVDPHPNDTSADAFARLFVLPQTGHGLSGTNYAVDGEGKSIPMAPIPNRFDRLNLLVDWVERKEAPPLSVTVEAGERSLPMCSYPAYPKYIMGPIERADSYKCTAP